MDDNTTTMPARPALDGGFAADGRLADQRPCSRCDGHQHLLGSFEGLGTYRCDTCELRVGFDLDADQPEFLIDRGIPANYTMGVFGNRLQRLERRLETR